MIRPNVSTCQIAVIGCGRWGPNHVRCLDSLADCHVHAVDLDTTKLAQIQSSFPAVTISDDYAQVLADPQVGGIVIATPAATHFSMVQAALRAGKHVLCEKPLCTTSSEAEFLVDLAHQKGCTLLVGHVFLFNPGIERLKQLVDDGALGDLRSLVAVRTNLGPIRHDVNAAFDLATHDVAVFNWLLDSEPELVSAMGGDFLQAGVEDVVFVHLKYPGGRVASIHASWLSPIKVRQMTVVGSQRMATWDDLAKPSVLVHERRVSCTLSGPEAEGRMLPGAEFSISDGRNWHPTVTACEPLLTQAQNFVHAIRTGERSRSDGRFSLGVMRTLEAISESLRAASQPIVI